MKRWLILATLASPVFAQQGVQLSWVASSTPGTTVSAYRALTCAGPFLKVGVNIPAAGPFNTIIPSTPGTIVAFQITAVVSNMESAPSNCFLFTIPSAPVVSPPASPTGLIVTISSQ